MFNKIFNYFLRDRIIYRLLTWLYTEECAAAINVHEANKMGCVHTHIYNRGMRDALNHVIRKLQGVVEGRDVLPRFDPGATRKYII